MEISHYYVFVYCVVSPLCIRREDYGLDRFGTVFYCVTPSEFLLTNLHGCCACIDFDLMN